MKLKGIAPWKRTYNEPRQCINRQCHDFADKSLDSQSNSFISHVWVWELDHKECWAPKNWCFWIVVLEKTLENPLDCKEIQPVPSEGDQPWDFFGRNDAEAETPVLWPPHVKSWLIGKDSDVGKIEGRRKRGRQRMRWLDSITDSMDMSLSKLGASDGLRRLACYTSWGHDLATEQQKTKMGIIQK